MTDTAETSTPTSAGKRFCNLFRDNRPVQSVAIHDVVSARLVEATGFHAATISGSAAAANTYALPDVGLFSPAEMTDWTRRITDSVDIPCMVDADDGGATALHVYRWTRILEAAGAGAVMYEDASPARYLGRPTDLIPQQSMVDKIHAAVDARRDAVVIARCNALSEERSLTEALDRGAAYAEAGADIIYLSGMPNSLHPRAANHIAAPLMANPDPGCDLKTVAQLSISLCVYPPVLLDIALAAMHDALVKLRETGVLSGPSFPTDLGALKSDLTRHPTWSALAQRYNVG